MWDECLHHTIADTTAHVESSARTCKQAGCLVTVDQLGRTHVTPGLDVVVYISDKADQVFGR